MKPFLSVLIPCRNEVRSLGRCLASIIASDYPAERMEVLVVDGASTDGTREVIADWARGHACIRMVGESGGFDAGCVELRPGGGARGRDRAGGRACGAGAYGIFRARSSIWKRPAPIMWAAVMRTRAQRDGPWAGPVVAALTHPFGVGGSRFRTGRPESGEEPRWVDTVFCGCWRREVFERDRALQ